MPVRVSESDIDAALAKTGVADATDEEIEELAHFCRADYLAVIREHAPDSYFKGVIGADARISGMLEKETAFELALTVR